LELPCPIEREVPDAERQDVVLLERRFEERVVGYPVDLSMDPLVQGHQLGGVEVDPGVELGEEGLERAAVCVRGALGSKAAGTALQHRPNFREAREVADVNARHE